MIITILAPDDEFDAVDVSVVTDLDTWVGMNLGHFEAMAAVTSALAGQHPAFLTPAVPVEELVDLDPEVIAGDLLDPDDFQAPHEPAEVLPLSAAQGIAGDSETEAIPPP